MKDKIIANNKQFVVQKGYVNNLTDKYLERRQESDDTTSGTQFIDLGLPSGTLWADRNIGANDPEDYGEYFRWGETTPFYEDKFMFMIILTSVIISPGQNMTLPPPYLVKIIRYLPMNN